MEEAQSARTRSNTEKGSTPNAAIKILRGGALHWRREDRGAVFCSDLLLLPYLSVEEISSNAQRFILLLHHRVSSGPWAWVAADQAAMAPYWCDGYFEVFYNPSAISLSESDYAQLVSFD